MSSPALKLPTSFLPANPNVSCPHLCLKEKLSEQVPLPTYPFSSICLHPGIKASLQIKADQYGCPLIRVLVVSTFTSSQLSSRSPVFSTAFCLCQLSP